VTNVVFNSLVGETVDPRSGAEVEVSGAFKLLERIEEVVEVIGVKVDGDGVDINVDGEVVGVTVGNSGRDVNTDTDVVLVFMVKNV
jgi:hypothetical protein